MRRLAVVAAVALGGCAVALQGIPKNHQLETTFPKTAAAPELPEQFKVVAFNIHKERAEHFLKGVQADRDTRDADVILLEEAPRFDGEDCSSACGAAKLLGFYAVYAPAHHAEERDIGVAVLSRSPITSARIIELPWNDVHFNAGRRAALAVTIQQAGRPITIYAVHLENRLSVADRRKQMTPILEDAKRQPTPVIIAGDFNTNPFHWISHWLPLPTASHQATKLEELVRSYGLDTPVKDSGATHRYIGMKLDAIYTRGFETRRFGTAHAKDVSDHLALWATVTAKPATKIPGTLASSPQAPTTDKSVAATRQATNNAALDVPAAPQNPSAAAVDVRPAATN